MNPFALLLLLVLGGLLWAVPRKWALAPFLAGCCFTTVGQGLDLGPISLPVFRLLMLIGIARVFLKGERIIGHINTIDKLMIAWAVWYFLASFFHDSQLNAGPVYVAGIIYNQLGFYFLVRIWCSDVEDTIGVIRIVALLLVPIACEMLFEKATGRNLFSVFGGVPENVLIREGKLRAQGAFLHPILAGTVGATCIPLFVGIYQKHRTLALTGIVAGMVMVLACASSGPVMSLMAVVFALMMWHFRHLTKAARIGAVVMYILLMFVMKQPPYYLISKIDISGGSTGWHRSFLIDQTLRYFSEWWLFGTDYTRHWMPDQGIAASPNHTDVTNYYISFAIGGGLPALLLFLFILARTFGWVGRIYSSLMDEQRDKAFMIWCFGSALFAHCVTGISVSYFDQSVVFLWLNVAVVSSMYSSMIMERDDGLVEETEVLPAEGFHKARRASE